MITNIIEIELLPADRVVTRPVHQWDIGQIIKVTDAEIEDGTPVDFGNRFMKGGLRAYVIDNQVTIPAPALQQERDLTGYVVITDENSETTVKEIAIPVIPRPKPEDYVDEEIRESTEFQVVLQKAEEVEANARAAAEFAGKAAASETAAENAATDAGNSATNAAGSATAAAASEKTASEAAGTATDKATEAGNSADAAKTSQTEAEKAKTDAESARDAAKTSEDNAKSHQESAGAAATNAGNSAKAAADSEQAAKDAAGTAEAKGKEATDAAAEALNSKNAAGTSATNAGNSAKEAADSEAAAKAAQQAAEAARDEALSGGKADEKVAQHNVAGDSHNDIRLWLSNVETWVKNLLDADDETLNQTSEMIEYMKDNRELIEQITTGKVSVTDIINNLTTNVSNKPLSAAQGVVLKGLIDALQTAVNATAKAADLTSHTGNGTVHITAAERIKWNQAVSDVDALQKEIIDQQDWFTNEIINVAHRGAMPTKTPENTLVAYAKAAEMGFDYVEVDIRLTSDGEIVMSHDATINRMARNKDGSTLSASINVADVTYSKLQQYVFCGSLYGTYPSVKIPTLEETVALCRGVGLKIFFDMYVEPTTELLDRMFSILDKYGMRDNVIWGSSTYNYVYAVRNYYAKANIYSRSSTYSDTASMLSGLGNLKTGQNRVIVAVRLEDMENYAPLLRENGFDVIYITPTKEQFISVYQYVTAVMSEDYVASDYLVEYMLTQYGVEAPEIETILLNLNRVKGTSYNSDNAESYYINPSAYDSTVIPSETECVIANLSSNSITVTENGKGGRGVAFPFFINHANSGLSRNGKSYTLTWNATGTTDTRFRLMMSDATTLKNADLDNKSGAKTSATIAVSADGKTITVNGTAYTFANVVVWIAFFFGCATSKTVSYTGVTLAETT